MTNANQNLNDFNAWQIRNEKIRTKRAAIYKHNKRVLSRINRCFPKPYLTIESEAGSVAFIEDVYSEGGRKMIRYSTYSDTRRTTYNETTMDNFMHSRRFRYILE